jgi:hypothetical protein
MFLMLLVKKSVAVATEEDKVDHFYKSIPVLAAYHKQVPVGKPVPSYLILSVTQFFNDRMPADQRKI